MSEFNRSFVNLYDLLICITNAEDLVSPELRFHHQKAAYLAYRIAERMGIPERGRKNLMLAGLLHDIGALSTNERLELLENEPPTANSHAFRGAQLLEGFLPLSPAAEIIRYHHLPWNHGEGKAYMGREVSVLSHILHLADRACVLVDPRENALGQAQRIRETILAKKGSAFAPGPVEAFMELSGEEYVWLDIAYGPLLYILPEVVQFDTVEMDMEQTVGLTSIFSKIIDYRSPFTAAHSAGVAAVAEKLAELAGFSGDECKMMRVAGNLHDLGKIAVRSAVLEKQDRLNAQEFNEIRSHTFYTFRLLQAIKGFETINKWASFHHEKLNGKGYPFHLRDNEIPLGSRIMAVADIFTAITEDRAYRKGMPPEQTARVLLELSEDGSVCPYVVSLVLEHFDMLNALRMRVQAEAGLDYKKTVAPIPEG
ncbi:MAG TPA: HD domain-containing phosphohydrolase [Feifaniaceae bacterium]|nr:HD domain-containing phosphohydrolase [Feifaniaceae bacterium]